MIAISLARTFSARRRRAALVVSCVALLGLSGCASMEEPATDNGSLPQLSDQVAADGSVRVDTEDARIAQLWSAAEQAMAEGDDERALEHLYAALELDQENALLWSRAAELQLDRDQATIAETLALRSNGLDTENRALQYRNWLIVEHARAMRGDLLGERTAHRRVQQYQYR